jgi:hypothetical protein
MTMRQWKALYSTLQIITYPNSCLPTPTDDQLDAFEAAVHFQLPNSYRSFLKIFGAGELACDFKILAPGYPAATGYNLQQFNDDPTMHFSSDSLQVFENPEQVEWLVYFSYTETSELIGWGPEDVRQPRQHEYGIYEVGRSCTLQLIAVSFSEFVTQVCLSEENLHPPGWNDEKFGSRRRFQPAYDVSGLQ